MRGCTGLAVAGLLLSLALPEPAEARPGAGVAKKHRAKARVPAPTFITATREPIQDRQEIVRDDPALAVSQPMLQQMTVADRFDIGIGLYSVVGQTEKREMRERTDPRIEVRPGETRVGGVGLRLSF